MTVDLRAQMHEKIALVERELSGSGRVLIRYSGTENKARVMVEGADEASVRAHAEDLAEALRRTVGAEG